MKLSELIRQLNLTLLTSKDYADREIGGCYIGDLLSWVMGRAQQGDVWITIMNNINIVAVASLTGCACILLCEDVTGEKLPDEIYQVMAAPQEVLDQCEMYLNLPADTRTLYNDLWTQMGIE